MTPSDLEKTYESMARNIDHFDEILAPVYLAKLALLMAIEIGDPDVVERCIESAARELER